MRLTKILAELGLTKNCAPKKIRFSSQSIRRLWTAARLWRDVFVRTHSDRYRLTLNIDPGPEYRLCMGGKRRRRRRRRFSSAFCSSGKLFSSELIHTCRSNISHIVAIKVKRNSHVERAVLRAERRRKSCFFFHVTKRQSFHMNSARPLELTWRASVSVFVCISFGLGKRCFSRLIFSKSFSLEWDVCVRVCAHVL